MRSSTCARLVADNAWNAGMVLSTLGEPMARPAVGRGHRQRRLDKIFDRGFGRDVLGDPLVVVAWLANHLAARGEQLKAGQVVMTGSLIPTQFPTEDATYRFDLAGIGSVGVRVALALASRRTRARTQSAAKRTPARRKKH